MPLTLPVLPRKTQLIAYGVAALLAALLIYFGLFHKEKLAPSIQDSQAVAQTLHQQADAVTATATNTLDQAVKKVQSVKLIALKAADLPKVATWQEIPQAEMVTPAQVQDLGATIVKVETDLDQAQALAEQAQAATKAAEAQDAKTIQLLTKQAEAPKMTWGKALLIFLAGLVVKVLIAL